jgi:hypothetical protein
MCAVHGLFTFLLLSAIVRRAWFVYIFVVLSQSAPCRAVHGQFVNSFVVAAHGLFTVLLFSAIAHGAWFVYSFVILSNRYKCFCTRSANKSQFCQILLN